MLELIVDSKQIASAQERLEERLKSELETLPGRAASWGGTTESSPPVLGAGAGHLLFVGKFIDPGGTGIPRWWNAFGIIDPDQTNHAIVVEINIARDGHNSLIEGFFARDPRDGMIHLMHTGGVGGGQKGIGKHAFIAWAPISLQEASAPNGALRAGYQVAALEAPDLIERIERYVCLAAKFKKLATSGELEQQADADFEKRQDAAKRYLAEFSGRKTGTRSGRIDYVSFHGEVVEYLRCFLKNEHGDEQEVFNDVLVDLYVLVEGRRLRIFEVKTSTDRQVLYTAIGQLMTHAGGDGAEDAARVLVVPVDAKIPRDIEVTLARLDIELWRFRRRVGRERTVSIKFELPAA